MSIAATAIATPPRVELVGSGLSVSAAWVRIERLWGAHSMVVVDALPVSAGAWYLVDWDVPLGVSVTWRATATSAAGVVMGVETVAATTPAPLDDTQAWLSDPADPSTALVVTLLTEGTDEQAEHPMAWSGQAPMGRDLPTAVMGQRTYGRTRSFAAYTVTEGEYRALEGLVMRAGVLLVRSGRVAHRSGLIYVAAQVSARPLHGAAGDWETDWLIAGDEVAPSTVGVIVPPRTWADVVAQHATWADVAVAYPTWLDLLRGPQ